MANCKIQDKSNLESILTFEAFWGRSYHDSGTTMSSADHGPHADHLYGRKNPVNLSGMWVKQRARVDPMGEFNNLDRWLKKITESHIHSINLITNFLEPFIFIYWIFHPQPLLSPVTKWHGFLVNFTWNEWFGIWRDLKKAYVLTYTTTRTFLKL